MQNPFEVTKAVDYTDDEINVRFVSFGADLATMVDPRAPVTQYLVGGKGGGRTHLMRYLSYQLQKKRAPAKAVTEQIKSDGYFGVYAPASTLDGNRFSGASIGMDAWGPTFAYATELWLAILTVDILRDAQEISSAWDGAVEENFCKELQSSVPLFNSDVLPNTFRGLVDELKLLRRGVDYAVNNAPLREVLDFEILFAPGVLIRNLGSCIQNLPGFSRVQTTYLLDELENLTARQQRFVNSLIREKSPHTSFIIGSRVYGLRTFETYIDGEINRRGSEYDLLVPEEMYAQSDRGYERFCRDVIERSIQHSAISYDGSQPWPEKLGSSRRIGFRTRELLDVVDDERAGARKHLTHLRNAVQKKTASNSLGKTAAEKLACPSEPLIEKLQILRFYQLWSGTNRNMETLISEAAAFGSVYLRDYSSSSVHTNFLRLWASDMVAQLYSDYQKELPYYGFDTCLRMSGYLPRNLLVSLKNIVQRSAWKGESPFGSDHLISVPAQNAAIRDASEWYFDDVLPMGAGGDHCALAIRRLGSFFRDIRLSDKPVEVSLTSFSSSMDSVSRDARIVIEECVSHRLLVEVLSGREARNYGELHRKFQLHPMLSPKFGLGLGRRGDLTLSSSEVNAIFDPSSDSTEYQRVAKKRLSPMNAPFTGFDSGVLF